MRTSRVLFVLLVVVVVMLPCGARGEQPAAPSGRYEGAIVIMGMELAIGVEFTAGAAGLAATIDIPQQGAKGVPLANVRFAPPRLHFELPAGPGLATFDGEVTGDVITGAFAQGGATGEFRLARARPAAPAAPTAPPPYLEEEVTFQTAAGSFAGSLTLPRGAGRHAAVVLITGSGSQNRDEELFGFKPFRIIADHLTRAGIVVLRYDDRGVGGTTASAAQATTADFASDALGAVALLKTRPEVDAGRIGLLGHSEGGVVAPLAATRSADVAFIVLVSGMGVTGERILLDQAELIGRASGASDAELARQAAIQKKTFVAVRSGIGWEELRAEIRGVVLAELEKAPASERQAIGDPAAYAERYADSQLAMARSPWFAFFLAYDPASTLAKVRCPVLALFGEKDLQVPAAANREAIVAALALGGNADVTTKVFPGANHLYQAAALGTPAEYPTLAKQFVPGFLDTISRWILSKTKS